MRPAASSIVSLRTYAIALFTGLLWGIASTAFIAAAVVIVNVVRVEGSVAFSDALRLTLEAASWAGVAASVLAVFPIGPIAGIAGWLIYRRGVVSPWAFAAVGALSAAVAPVIVIAAAVDTMRYPGPSNYAVIDESALPLLVAVFAALGALSGFMAGRVIRRGKSQST